MKCEEFKPFLDPLLDNELPTQPVAMLMEHIRNCCDCQQAWDARVALRERVRVFASRISLPEGGLRRVDEALQKDMSLKRNSRRFAGLILSSVAAALVIIPSTFFILKNSYSVSQKPASVQEIVQSFRKENSTTSLPAPAANLGAISQSAGFPITELKMAKWHLSSAEMIKLPQHSQCLVKLTYISETNGKRKKVVCYQACHGQITADGLKEHQMNGRYFCCGKISDLSVVYWPNQGKDHLLVSTLPERDLVRLAFGS